MRRPDGDLRELIQESPVLLLLFGDAACGPCHALEGRLDLWLLDHPEVLSGYIPIREEMEVCAQLHVFSAPSLLIYLDGKLFEQRSGCFSLTEVLSRLERLLAIRESGFPPD